MDCGRDCVVIMKDLETVRDPRCRRCGRKCNQNYELCSRCYRDGEPEITVEGAVFDYFSKFPEFSAKRQHKIRIGTYTPRPDVVLLDQQGNLAVIAECKRGGIVDYGIDQLKSYLIASDVQFGVFANSTNPDQWKFYENLRRKQFSPMRRLAFERKIATERTIESIREEKNRLNREITEIRTQLDLKGPELNNLKQKVKQANNELVDIKKEIIPLKKESKEIWQEEDKKYKELNNYNDYLEQRNTSLQKSIEHKTGEIRDIDRLSRLDELEAKFAQESIYEQNREELEQLGKLDSEIKSKQQLAQQNQERYAACKRNSVETNQKEQQIAQVSQEREFILQQLRVVVNQLKGANLEQQTAQIEENRRQLVQDLQKRKCIRGKLIKEISRLKEAKSELEEEMRQEGQQPPFEENEVRPAYVQIELEIDELKTEKSKIEAKIGHRIFLLLSEAD